MADWQRKHERYGPCDAMGPKESCSQCSGILERIDGSWVDAFDGKILRKPPIFSRMRKAIDVLLYRDGLK